MNGSIEPNDPRLTAYALDELAEAERAEVEAWLAANPAARDEIDAIRETGNELARELHEEPCPELHEDQRAAIVKRGEQSRMPWRRRAVLGLAMAASLLLVML